MSVYPPREGVHEVPADEAAGAGDDDRIVLAGHEWRSFQGEGGGWVRNRRANRCARPVTPPRIGVANARTPQPGVPGSPVSWSSSVRPAGAGFEGRFERAELDRPFAEFWAPCTCKRRSTRCSVRSWAGWGQPAPWCRARIDRTGGARGWWGKQRERHIHVPWTCGDWSVAAPGNTPTVVYAPAALNFPGGWRWASPRARTAGSRRPRAERRNAAAPRIGPLRAG